MSDLSTQLIHHPYEAPAGFSSVNTPVYRASTVVFPSVAAMRKRDAKHKTGYGYGLHGTPTTFTLEERIATLEGGRFCTLVPSGLAAVALVNMAFLKAGDEVLLPDNAYGPNKTLAQNELKAWGISHQVYDPMNPADLAAKLTNKTRLVWLEVPGSISLEFADIPALVSVIRAHGDKHPQGIVSALDNTWGAGIAFNAFDLGVDVSMQALTKYPSGGGDVLMGSVVTRDDDLHQLIHCCHMRVGFGVAGNDVEMVLRSLPSIVMRYQAQDQATRTLAHWMQAQMPVAEVRHPALSGSPGHAAWARDCSGAACLFSAIFKPDYSTAQIDAFCDSLKCFKLGYSWAGPMSLCVPYDMLSIRSNPWSPKGVLVRFSVGFESVADLQADLAQGLEKLQGR